MTRLAIDGGNPVRNTPFPPWPVFDSEEIAAVNQVLASGKVNYWTGSECNSFEKEFAAACGTQYAISLANGTLALELALLALDIGFGDEVVVPSRTFIATASSVVARGARPVVADIDPISGNLTAETVAKVLTEKTRAVIPVHMAGWPCEMEPLLALTRSRQLHLIEDCSQAHGATYQGQVVGSFGVCATFSFCQDKIISTGGEGGMLVTSNEGVWKRAWEYKDHGKNWDAVHRRDHPPGFRWLHDSFGSNFRMTEMQAAIGRCQLAKLPQWLALRSRNAKLFSQGLNRLTGLYVPKPGPGIGHAYYKLYAYLVPEALKSDWTIDRVMAAITAEGVPCLSGSCPEIYRELAFLRSGMAPVLPLPNSERIGRISLMFPTHPGMEPLDIQDMVEATYKVITAASR